MSNGANVSSLSVIGQIIMFEADDGWTSHNAFLSCDLMATAIIDNGFGEFLLNIYLVFKSRREMEGRIKELKKFIKDKQVLSIQSDVFSLLDGELTTYGPNIQKTGVEPDLLK